MRDSSAYNEKEAEAKFKLAQQHTNEVKNLTSEMEVIRKRIAIPGRTLAASATKSLVKPGELSQEEVLALNPPAEEKAVTRTETSSTPVTNYSPATVQEFAKNSFSIADKPAYSESNPIPMNPPLPEGLVFKVQIGAFRKQIPAEKFEGVQPITAETTRPEWVRYCVGLFQTFEPAVVVKKEMQQRGFKDAFVVAYLNGKRIELSEAYAMVAKNKATPDQSYVQNSKKEMALLRANNIRPENIASIRNNQLDEDEKDFYGQDASKIKSSIATVEYAVQVGVFRSTVVPTGLRTLMPLFTEKIRTNLFRFTTDHYVDYAAADSMRRIARNEGVKDAFIVVYRNGVQSALSSVPLAERKVRITSTSNQIATTNSAASQNQDVTRNNSTSVATATGDEKVTYKVQLGAFKNNIPFSSVVSFLSVADKGITELTDDRGLHIFYAGNVSSYSAAVAMRDEIVQKGVTDAFVVALKNGKRVVITEEMKGGN
jgi:cell division protein FtsN